MIARGLLLLAASLTLAAPAPGGKVEPAAESGAGPDSAQVARLLGALRGSDPLVCALATELVGTGVRWSTGWEGMASLHDEPADARSVRRVLGEGITDAAALRLLGPELGSESACVRRTAAALLGESGKPAALGLLRSAAGSRDARLREAGTFGIGVAGDSADAPRLRALLADQDPNVVRLATWGLGAMGDESATSLLIPLLRHGQPAVRRTAAWALGRLAEDHS